jgi:hypothetical protein
VCKIPGEKPQGIPKKIRYYREITVIQKKLQYFVCSGQRHGNMDEEMETWRHGNIGTRKHGDMEHRNMETWKHGDMEIWKQ